ncbi:hypothetical protein [Falsiroseomonas sp.]|uniref:hypothetical protein n=1 Tax=Falsiroseomonas sp. TaxID=2870721 RepID=UPI003F6ED9F6
MFRQPGPARLTPLDAMLAVLLRQLAPVAPRLVALPDAPGRVLASALVTAGPVPARVMALREGWAVVAAETEGAGVYAPSPLPGPAIRVRPGDPMPEGRDAVLDPFDAMEAGEAVMAMQEVAAGDGLRPPGADIAAGSVIRAAGERLQARDLPALAATGLESVALRIPRILLRHRDPAVAAMIEAWLRAEGAERVGDTPDLVLTDDPALEEALRGLGARPGMEAAVGRRDGVPALLLPPMAEDAAAAFLLLALPALRVLSGAPAPAPVRARLARKVASAVGITELVPLAVDTDGMATPLAIGALPLGALARAQAVLVVPPGTEGYEAGTMIEALSLV